MKKVIAVKKVNSVNVNVKASTKSKVKKATEKKAVGLLIVPDDVSKRIVSIIQKSGLSFTTTKSNIGRLLYVLSKVGIGKSVTIDFSDIKKSDNITAGGFIGDDSRRVIRHLSINKYLTFEEIASEKVGCKTGTIKAKFTIHKKLS